MSAPAPAVPRHYEVIYNAIDPVLKLGPEKVLEAVLQPSVVWALRLVLEEGRELKRPDSLVTPRAASTEEWRTVEEPPGNKRGLFETIKHNYWEVKAATMAAPVIYRSEKLGLRWERLVLPTRS